MCGIFGIVSKICDEKIGQKLIDGLQKLEYRGYDSAGIAVYDKTGIRALKSIGQISALQSKYNESPITGEMGIAHTRWATHGAVSLINTHPIIVEDIAVVHNGVVENYLQLKQECWKKYEYQTSTQTDTEIIAALIHHQLEKENDLLKGIRNVMSKLQGKMSFALMSRKHQNTLVIVNLGKQVVIGNDENSQYITSDSVAVPDTVQNITYLHDRDIAIISSHNYQIFDFQNELVERQIEEYVQENSDLTMLGHSTYMHKEIYEQKNIIQSILENFKYEQSSIKDAFKLIDYNRFNRIHIIACGAAFYAGYVGKYLFEKNARIPTNIDIASEFCQRKPITDQNTAYIFISQSGETADTIAALELVKQCGVYTIGIVNRLGSYIAKNVDVTIPTCAGIEQSVAATKTFSAQLLIMILLAGYIKDKINIEKTIEVLLGNLDVLEITEEFENNIANIVQTNLLQANRIIYTARDALYPICLEGALKIKEIGYIAADAIPSGEIKHGPLALVDSETPIIILAPYSDSELFHKTTANIQEIKARNGKIILITCEEGRKILNEIIEENIVVLPTIPEVMLPICYAIPLQLIAYHYALAKGYNIDKPRNLAKSVTVE